MWHWITYQAGAHDGTSGELSRVLSLLFILALYCLGGNGVVVWIEYTQTNKNWNTFLAHSSHVPAALCAIRLQRFDAVFSALKYSCVLPNIIPTVKLICSNQRLT